MQRGWLLTIGLIGDPWAAGTVQTADHGASRVAAALLPAAAPAKLLRAPGAVNDRAPPAVMQWNNGNGGYGENDGFEDAFRNWRDKATDAFGNLRDKAMDAFGGQSGSQGPNSQRGGPPQGPNSQWGGPPQGPNSWGGQNAPRGPSSWNGPNSR